MSHPDTICNDLSRRVELYQTRYGSRPEKLPVTLDEWSWLSEWCAYAKALASGSAPLLNIPKEFAGVRLQLVAQVMEFSDGSLVVRL